MRSLHLALILAGGLLLQACAGTPAEKPTTEGKIVSSIIGSELGDDLQCPSNLARYCTGTGKPLKCGCVSRDSLRQMLRGGY